MKVKIKKAENDRQWSHGTNRVPWRVRSHTKANARDDGSVIVSKESPNQWIFTTIQIPQDWQHLVSGNRAFGYTTDSTSRSMTFYTRGVDRPTGILDNYLAPTIFGKADMLWSGLMSNIAKFVNQHGGKASVNAPVISRPQWSNFRR